MKNFVILLRRRLRNSMESSGPELEDGDVLLLSNGTDKLLLANGTDALKLAAN